MDKRVISSFTTALDELNILTTASYKMASGDSAERLAAIVDDVLSFLINAYTLGVKNASIMLGHDMEVNLRDMDNALYFVIDGKTFEDRIADHIARNDLTGLQTLVESEYHRVYNAAVQDCATDFVNNGNFGVNKTWCTVGDEKVRDSHQYLEGQTVPIEEEFFTFDRDHAAYPGGFGKAENNVNCRCIVELSTDE